jgi:hypothetical protein
LTGQWSSSSRSGSDRRRILRSRHFRDSPIASPRSLRTGPNGWTSSLGKISWSMGWLPTAFSRSARWHRERLPGLSRHKSLSCRRRNAREPLSRHQGCIPFGFGSRHCAGVGRGSSAGLPLSHRPERLLERTSPIDNAAPVLALAPAFVRAWPWAAVVVTVEPVAFGSPRPIRPAIRPARRGRPSSWSGTTA